jgi:hypothetical protein
MAGPMTDVVPPDPDPDGQDAALTDTGLGAERERLARTLRDTRLQLAMTEARLAALEQSATMGLGRAFVNAAKRPWPRGALLPRDLFKLWRERSGGKEGATLAARLASAQLADLAGAGERFLSALTPPGRPELDDPALALAGLPDATAGLVITGALTALGCATLSPDAIAVPLLPHDADVMLESAGADLVLIEAAALLPGSPWAYATDPAGADRGRRLARLIVMARSLGKPVVLVRNVPPAMVPGLGWVADSCDVVSDDGLGVQLARFNPIGVSPGRPRQPVYAGERDPRETPGVRAALDALAADGVVTLSGARSWRALPGLYRSHAVFATASAARALEQRACGAQVVMLPAAASDFGSLPPADPRAALREIFLSSATPARLAALVSAAGLPASQVTGRRIAVTASAGSAAEASALAASMLRQRLRPAEVIVSAPASAAADGVAAALAGLGDRGIAVRVVPEHDKERALPLSRYASSPWVAPAEPGQDYPEDYLLDLACARECSQADAVGFGPGDYEFARWVVPALARRELLGPDAPPSISWGSHGLRLFSTTSGAPASDTTTTSGTPTTSGTRE